MQVVWLDSPVVSISDSTTARLRVRLPAIPLPANSPRQIVHTPQPIGAMPQFGGPANKLTKNAKKKKSEKVTRDVIHTQHFAQL